eukprot:scaffold2544_cov401-Prasinococcus_capsulatus_cf.AAC.11
MACGFDGLGILSTWPTLILSAAPTASRPLAFRNSVIVSPYFGAMELIWQQGAIVSDVRGGLPTWRSTPTYPFALLNDVLPWSSSAANYIRRRLLCHWHCCPLVFRARTAGPTTCGRRTVAHVRAPGPCIGRGALVEEKPPKRTRLGSSKPRSIAACSSIAVDVSPQRARTPLQGSPPRPCPSQPPDK